MWAAEGARIGQIEAQAGGIPYAGGTQRIASRAGAARAAEMVLTGAVYPPETLALWGLINRVVPAGRLADEGRAFAIELATGATRAHIATKRILRTWRSRGVANADEANKAEGPAIMLSEGDGVVVVSKAHHNATRHEPIPTLALSGTARFRCRFLSPTNGC